MNFFYSDPHFGHANILKYANRPFESIHHHDQELINRWNAVVSEKDDIYILGDFSFKSPQRTIELCRRLNGRKYLILGNHDKVIRKNAQVRDQFEWTKEYYELKVPELNQKIVMSHYPFLTWNKSHHGSWSMHGHTHDLRPFGNSGKHHENLKRGFRVHVGVDAWDYTPITIKQIQQRAKAQGLM